MAGVMIAFANASMFVASYNQINSEETAPVKITDATPSHLPIVALQRPNIA
jgi:hypothetical protein